MLKFLLQSGLQPLVAQENGTHGKQVDATALNMHLAPGRRNRQQLL